MVTNIQIRSKGTITLPAEFRRRYGLGEGETLTLIDMGNGTFMLTPKISRVIHTADKVAKMVKEANVPLEELLETLDEEREKFYQEHYVKN
jgi:AbrB family looped-hinge helix DNA binding protein